MSRFSRHTPGKSLRTWSAGCGCGAAQRVSLGFALIILVMAALSGFIAQWAARNAQAQEQLMTRVAPLGDAIHAVESRLLTVSIGVHAQAEEVEAARQALLQLGNLPMDDDVAAVVVTLRSQTAGYLTDAKRLGQNTDSALAVEAEQALVRSRERVFETLRVLGSLHRQKRDATWASMEAARRRVVEGTAVGVPLAVLLFGLLALFTVRSIRERARDDLAEVDRRHAEFLGLLAHELRNPLAAITNSLFVLNKAGQNLELRTRAEQVIGRQTRILVRLVEDLLDVMGISSGKLRLVKEKLDLVEVVRDCVDDHRDAAEKRGVTLDVDLLSEPQWVEGDRTRLQQVIGNLLDNALKFAGEKKRVGVSLRRGSAHSVELTVADQGIGIGAAVLERLFQPFNPDSSAENHQRGLGLGLTLVKSLIELHGGSVTAHSAGLGLGATFTLRVPLAPVS